LLPDTLAYRIGTQQRVPAARQEQYFQGLQDMITSISGLVHEDAEMMAYRQEYHTQKAQTDSDLVDIFVIIGFFMALIV
jgi:uncharacterized membrane protein YgcG